MKMKNEEPNSLVGTTKTKFLKSGWTARGYRIRMGLSALFSRSLTVTLKNIRANASSYKEAAAMNNDDARAHKRCALERSALSYFSNIVFSLQYCPKAFILGRKCKNRSSFLFVHLTSNSGGAQR